MTNIIMIDGWPTKDDEERNATRAGRLKDQAAVGGLRFDAYLPPALAVWLLEAIEKGEFRDPQEAALAAVSDARDLQPHTDLRRELFARVVRQANLNTNDDRSNEDLASNLNARVSKHEPAVWVKY